jgi:hypothetical protein
MFSDFFLQCAKFLDPERRKAALIHPKSSIKKERISPKPDKPISAISTSPRMMIIAHFQPDVATQCQSFGFRFDPIFFSPLFHGSFQKPKNR